ncbi:hypothetical protein DYBT9275_01966 [Dyadobacter sp. CECT 9275]|uniref:Uncharacterized protein n=1 Tax=Dyadobacter helix TaxID=2822344 RepID=A0A916N3Y3_9BACT|nr:hypothetical protein [Dyadobacter sp. CECT 9275]CAG4998269.1 hypothetical protein DYBT9275_01966 [Dyadobacter sp. CECT 9275]
MNKEILIPGYYIIRFQTAPAIPAPFSHYDTLKLDITSATELHVDFAISYLDRDELTEEEILDEGFTMDDDFKWKGAFSPIWIKEFEKIFTSSKIIRQREEKEYEDFVEIELQEEEKRVTVYPVDRERWAYFIQEFMQAILEIAGREKPFELTYLQIGDNPVQLDLKASFADKSFVISKNSGRPAQLDWQQLQKILDTVYKAEFIPDEAATSKPKKDGKYISAGDGLWYQLGVAVVEVSGKSKDLPKIESLFNNLAK